MKGSDLFMVLSAAQILAGDSYWDTEFNKPRALSKPLTADDLKPEYDLIMAKKSKLSSNQRRIVVARYNKLLTKPRGDE